MNEERLEYIKEKVNQRNLANVMMGYNTDKTDNEILELIDEIERLKKENARLWSQNKDLEDKILWQEEHI